MHLGASQENFRRHGNKLNVTIINVLDCVRAPDRQSEKERKKEREREKS